MLTSRTIEAAILHLTPGADELITFSLPRDWLHRPVDTWTMQVDASGAFVTTAIHNRPTGMANLNNEGFSVAGADECVGGSKPVYWADDSNDSGHALRKGTITC